MNELTYSYLFHIYVLVTLTLAKKAGNQSLPPAVTGATWNAHHQRRVSVSDLCVGEENADSWTKTVRDMHLAYLEAL